MSVKQGVTYQRRSGLNNVNLSGCVISRPYLHHPGGKSECRFWVCDGLNSREAKFQVEAVARGKRAVYLEECLDTGSRVAITGMLRASLVSVAGGQILDYELVISHADPGERLEGQCVERGGLNNFAISGVVTKAPTIKGLPGQDECVFWICDGDGEEESSLRLPVFLSPGRVSALTDHIEVGDRLAVGGFLRSRRLFVSGSPVYECQFVATHLDGGFLSSGD